VFFTVLFVDINAPVVWFFALHWNWIITASSKNPRASNPIPPENN
jgi:hypothetical protein